MMMIKEIGMKEILLLLSIFYYTTIIYTIRNPDSDDDVDYEDERIFLVLLVGEGPSVLICAVHATDEMLEMD